MNVSGLLSKIREQLRLHCDCWWWRRDPGIWSDRGSGCRKLRLDIVRTLWGELGSEAQEGLRVPAGPGDKSASSLQPGPDSLTQQHWGAGVSGTRDVLCLTDQLSRAGAGDSGQGVGSRTVLPPDCCLPGEGWLAVPSRGPWGPWTSPCPPIPVWGISDPLQRQPAVLSPENLRPSLPGDLGDI